MCPRNILKVDMLTGLHEVVMRIQPHLIHSQSNKFITGLHFIPEISSLLQNRCIAVLEHHEINSQVLNVFQEGVPVVRFMCMCDIFSSLKKLLTNAQTVKMLSRQLVNA